MKIRREEEINYKYLTERINTRRIDNEVHASRRLEMFLEMGGDIDDI